MSDAVGRRGLLPPPTLLPQREDERPRWIQPVESAITALPSLISPSLLLNRLAPIVPAAAGFAAPLHTSGASAMQHEIAEVRRLLRKDGLRTAHVARSFAVIRELADRILGLRHFDVQLLGGYALLEGMIAEMATGEGKTLTATLAAGTAALAGIPVHVVTVNDYLAARDAAAMGPIYAALGLSVGVVVHERDQQERRAAYACDITYVTNKEVAFDYLRDRIVLGGHSGNLRLKLERLRGAQGRHDRVVMRGLHYAIVDEADSVLVDEARTPLIISSNPKPADEQSWANEALSLARELDDRVDYRVMPDERRVELTEPGCARIAALSEKLGGLWLGRIRREESVRQALCALKLFRSGEHYLVRDDKVQIVDEYTGRIMPDRSWNEGLHQLIEAKEKCAVTARKITLARMSYQRFFRRYQRLSGMSGTVREVAGELGKVYRLRVVGIPSHRPVIRRDRAPTISSTLEDKLNRIAERTAALRAQGRPVLIGTRSVAASEALSARLEQYGLPHVVLNATQDGHEADIIAQAGAPGRITVATNMAGRGVDVRLGEGVSELGGLYVILSERHEAGRIDRQFMGRCARQGEPGETEFILSLEDPLLPALGWSNLARRFIDPSRAIDRIFARMLFHRAQRRAERTHSRIRSRLLRSDRELGDMLAFAGEME
jgi:preprotein translocase subunit SecA